MQNKEIELKTKLFERFNEEEVSTTSEYTSIYNVLCALEDLRDCNKLINNDLEKDIKRLNFIFKFNKDKYNNAKIKDIKFLLGEEKISYLLTIDINNKNISIFSTIPIEETEILTKNSIFIQNAYNSEMSNIDRLKMRNTISNIIYMSTPTLTKFINKINEFGINNRNINHIWNNKENKSYYIGDDFLEVKIDLNDSNNSILTYKNKDYFLYDKLYDYIIMYNTELAKKTKVSFDSLDEVTKNITLNYLNKEQVKTKIK